ncbi:OprD family porin [Pseudomonas sp. MYb185]|uniref:OprD family porin n=1 Tax=Pseudomonas sp. MYb185 TaxID=1848729 RepID=UPI000CFE3092|nr:OprD family porin [Pseudomonas sp. MYb185]PRB79988.1 outer membrane porin, OprD family [Pseudomonas sp. MYb185]
MKRTLIASAVAAGLLSLPTLSVAQGGGFVEDAKANLSLRNLYFDGDYKNSPNSPSDREWGQGFMLKFNSGYTQGPVGLGLDVFARSGIRLDSGSRRGKADTSRQPGTMFPLENDGSAVEEFSQIDFAAKAKISNTELKAGRGLEPNLPIAVRNDGRLLPQTYSGAMLTSNEIDNLTLRIGHLDESSGRAATSHEGLRIGGSNVNADVNKFQYLGGDAKLGENLVASYYFAQLKDYYNQHFLGAVHTLDLGAGQLITDLRYFDSDSHGANSSATGRANGYTARGVNNNGEVDNRAMSAMFTYKLSNHALGLGYQKMSGDSDFAFLDNGGGSTAYLITDSQINKFERAGEKTWVGEYSYNFADYVPGLSFGAKYLRGSDFDVAPGNGDKEWERNLRLDYTVQQGFLKDLGVSLRHASLRTDAAQADQDQLRVYLTYNFVLL